MLGKEGLSWPCPGGRWILALLIGSGGLAVPILGGSNRGEITLDIGNSVREMREVGSKQVDLEQRSWWPAHLERKQGLVWEGQPGAKETD